MVRGVRLLTVCLVLCCVVGFAVSPVIALGEGSPPAEGTGASSSSESARSSLEGEELLRAEREAQLAGLEADLFGEGSSAEASSSKSSPPAEGAGTSVSLESGLVTSGSPVQGEETQAEREAKLDNPEAVSLREESQTKYENLNSEQAAKLAGEAFPAVIDEPAGGPPKLPAGQSITAFPAGNVASLDLGEGKHGVVESLEPMAVEGSSGQRVPVDLSLSESGGAFHPTTPLVGVTIPKQLGEGVQIPAVGVSLTPVNEQGSSLTGSEGTVDGASVLYSNTEADSDTVVKPMTAGFEADTMLRSVESPQQLSFRLGLPAGASLSQSSNGSGPVRVLDEGAVLALVLPPSARDAAGTAVPVSMSVSGDTLTLTVDHRARSYEYPIEVDPTVTDSRDVEEESHWRFESYGTSFYNNMFYYEEGHPYELRTTTGGQNEKNWGELFYSAQGESHIYEFVSETYAAMPTNVENRLDILSTSGPEPEIPMPSSYGRTTPPPLCPVSGCPSTGGIRENIAEYVQYANANGGNGGYANLSTASVSLAQTYGPTTELDTKDATLPFGEPNLLYTNEWVKPTSTAGIQAFGSDPGVGTYGFKFSSPTSPEWKGEWPGCGSGAVCSPTATGLFSLHGLRGVERGSSWSWCNCTDEKTLKEGNNTVELTAIDSMNATDVITTHIKIDGTPPHSLAVSGLPSVVGEQEYPLSFSATDGSGSVESSGVASIKLAVDGHELGSIGGACSPGPCTGTAPWTLNGSEYGVGEHKFKITATDKAGNVATEEFTFHVHHATPVALGPGAVNPQSGEFSMGATDVSIGAPGASLMVSRNYRSRHLTAGAAGPLGPQWSLSVGGQESITRLANGNATLTASSGGQTTFTSSGGGKFTSPTGDANLTLTEGKNSKGELTEYVLKNAADDATTIFTSTEGPTGSLWKPTKQEGPLASQAVRYTYQTVEGVTEPKYALAPEPAGVTSCMTRLEKKEELVKGCRALAFGYAEKTKESIGENRSQWGEYKGRLKEVKFIAYNPAAGSEKIEEKTVAEYAYDKLGRLRAEWNPQISPALETAYGYDAQNHVTALTPPGQESWAFTYGTITGDTNTGRLLKVTRAPASATLWKGEPPKNSETPKLSGSPVVGIKMGVSGGASSAWSNEPVAYGYQWEDCNTKGEACTAILGATNANYTVASGDVGHTLVAQVTATNGGGSVLASSLASTTVLSKAGGFTQLIDSGYSVNAVSCVAGTTDCVVSDSKGNALYATNVSTTSSATWHSWSGPTGESPSQAVDCPTSSLCLLADGKSSAGGYMYYATSLGGAWTNAFEPSYGVDAISCASSSFCIDGQGESGGFIRYSTSPGSTSWTAEDIGGSTSIKGVFCLSSSFCAAVDNVGDVYVATSTSQIESATWTKTNVDGTSALNGVVCTSTTSCMAVDGAGNLINLTISEGKATATKHNIDGTNSLTAVTCTGSTCVTVDNSGNVFVSKNSGETWKKEYTLSDKLTSVSCASTTLCATVDTTGNVTAFNPAGGTGTEGEHYSPGPGSTVEYHVPLSGTGLPTMTNEEVEKWGQGANPVAPKDYPVEGMAIIAPDEPQGWPASKYTRASITYLDNQARTVNTASPTGAISTTEYNETNDVVRSLSPDNRAAALKEGCKVVKTECKSAEVSKLLDTESTYNTTGSEPGTELLSVLGPQHNVELTNGTKAEARAHTVYSYDEGAPTEGGPYHLVTTTTEGAEIAGKEEPASVRTTKLSYSGQEKNLGWKLRKPTSVTVDPSGLKLVHTTVYEEETGNVSETRMPASPGTNSPHDTQTIYYTTAANSKYKGCGEHAQWANLPCQTQPAKQPETSGVPNLPVTTVTYNMWDEPEKTIETVGSITRTNTSTYDPAGRLKTSATSSSVGTALPTITDEYNKETGALEKQCANEDKPCSEGKPRTITGVDNTLGQMTSYTDADENTSTYEYETEKDYRLIKVNTGKGTETYKYNETTGLPIELISEYGTTKLAFTATYDSEGNTLTEGYPNGMKAEYAYNQNGKPTGLEYIKTTDCTEKCTWFSDVIVPSIHGQALEQTSTLATGTLSHQAYTDDAAGRLTQVQNTPGGKGCSTRVYAYEEDTNRTSLTTYQPNSKNECSTETASTVEKHTYDPADRLTDTGTKYSEFGNITTLPAADAGGKETSENLTSTFYTDNQLASQTQSGETIGYNLDPTGRTRETVSTGKNTADVIDHYAAGDAAPAWTVETPSGDWTRNIQGLGGGLAAIQVNGATPVLQLTNLHGDIVATAALSETETKLLSSIEMSEYGVPTTSAPAKYSWLGGERQPTELASGVIAMGARSYVPQLGRYLQTDPVPGGSANAYAYTFGDPVDQSDPSGADGLPTWAIEYHNHVAQELVEAATQRRIEEEERKAAEEAAALAAAEAAAEAAAAAAAAAAAPPPEAPAEPLGGSADWLCEDAAITGQEVEGCGGGGGGSAGVINPGQIDGISIRQGLCAGLGALVIACSPHTRPDEEPPSGRYSPAPVERKGAGRGANKTEQPSPGDECACDGMPDPVPGIGPGDDNPGDFVPEV
jgi:RHS repeat-associated protein